MILVVAPYTGNSEGDNVKLGASKKIRFVISILSKISNEIVLVNSAHNENVKKTLIKRKIVIAGVEVTEIVLPTIRNSTIGKFLNLFHIKRVLKCISSLTSKPELVWFYNGYAFEMLFAKAFRKACDVPFVLELEDWHFARNRRSNIKSYIDFYAWRNSAALFSRVYAINADVKRLVSPLTKDVVLLPGVVSNDIIKISENRPLFSKDSSEVHIGYFGGLSEEKGADIVLALIELLPENFVIHVTGTGVLKEKFEQANQRHISRFYYYGVIDDSGLVKVMERCDIILNPHTPLEYFGNGIFPFKVIEAISAGRLLITTKLSFEGFEGISEGVIIAEHSASAFAKAILNGCSFYRENRNLIERSRDFAINMFGEEFVLASVRQMLNKKPFLNIGR